jgi:hypothetical protein
LPQLFSSSWENSGATQCCRHLGVRRRHPASRGDELANLPLIEQPWLRVALLLTAFSVLYLAVEVLSDSDKRSAFFESGDNALRRRLAVRLAYYEVLQRRWMAQHAYLEAIRNRQDRRRTEPDLQAHSGGARDGRQRAPGDVHNTGGLSRPIGLSRRHTQTTDENRRRRHLEAAPVGRCMRDLAPVGDGLVVELRRRPEPGWWAVSGRWCGLDGSWDRRSRA